MKSSEQYLLSRISTRAVVVGVIGMGYVGLPLMLSAASKRFRVVGFDIDAAKVAKLNRGSSPLEHIPSDQIRRAIDDGLFEATSDLSRLGEADILIMCVPTPLGKHREPDLSFVIDTTKSIAAVLKSGRLIILESTTYPGTTSDVVRPILEEAGLKSGKDFFLAYSPEREDPGNRNFTTARIPKVVGGDGEAASRLAQAFYGEFVERVVPVSSTATAEAVKITENVFRAVNIALVNELKMIYSQMGIDIFEVIDAAKTKPFGYMPFYPGPGLGGHCIPIDPFYLTWKAREFNVNTRFIELAGEINSDMPRYVVERVADVLDRQKQRGLSGANILVVGVAYKKDVDDTRESPALLIIELLQRRGASVEFYDPHVKTIPTTRQHPGLADMKSIPFDLAAIAKYDLVLIVTDHRNIDWAALVEASQLVVDTRNVAAGRGTRPDKIFSA